MIKANDLRLENWVYLVDKESTIQKQPIQVNLTWMQMLEALEPILLTPEILEKAGFSKQESSDSVVNLYFYGVNPITQDFLITLNWVKGRQFPFYQNGSFEIKTLHQLQNLYNALTGEELNINL
jgi:hypothetical protein